MVLALSSMFLAFAAAPPPPIVNGDTTSDYESVGVLLLCDNRGYCSDFCSGTVIDSKWVLTAAHCVEAFDDYARAGYTGYFGVGRNLDALTDYAEFADWHEHPDYSSRDLQNDIGIVELKTAIGVDPMPLNTDRVTSGWVGDDLTYVGWGITTDSGSDSGTKRYAMMPVYDYDTQFIYSYDGPDDQNLCSGDSGGASLETVGSGYELAGVNSFVFSYESSSTACIGGGAGVTRVDQHIDWIEGYTGSLSGSDTGGGGWNAARALAWSANAWTTSGRAGRCSSWAGRPRARAISWARSRTVTGRSAPTLKTSFFAAATSGARAMSGATSSMWVKARVWRPSPKTVIGWPRRHRLRKMPMTLRYGSERFWRSP